MNFIDKLILLTFPFMDVGFIVFGIPLRIGELAFFLFFLRLINFGPLLKKTRLNTIGVIVLLLLFLNLILTVTVKFFCEVDDSFYSKYVLRNILYLIIFSSFIIKPIDFGHIKVKAFIKYIFYVVAVFYGMEYIDYYLIGFNWGDLVFVSRQSKHVFNGFLIRFSGPSSEPAYIIPLLSIPLMFGLIARNLKYALWSIIFILLTFSSFGYLIVAFAILFFLNVSSDKELKRKAKNAILYIGITIGLTVLVFFNKVSVMIAYNWDKFQAYFGIGNVYEWSAFQRSGHIMLGLNLFMESSWLNKIFGNGTGYYSMKSKAFTKFYLDDAEEAHNLYISTLTDRGLIGLFLIVFLFYVISKIKIPKSVTGDYKYLFIAIKFGAFVRMLHWFFTGMLWQYYFWIEVILLISASAYHIKLSDERR